MSLCEFPKRPTLSATEGLNMIYATQDPFVISNFYDTLREQLLNC